MQPDLSRLTLKDQLTHMDRKQTLSYIVRGSSSQLHTVWWFIHGSNPIMTQSTAAACALKIFVRYDRSELAAFLNSELQAGRQAAACLVPCQPLCLM